MSGEIYKNRKNITEERVNERREERRQYNERVPSRREVLREHDNSSLLNLLSQVEQKDKGNDGNNK